MIEIITASAGTGKTWQLTELLSKSIESGCEADRVMATTFTVKASQDLASRARSRLIRGGLNEAALLLGASLIGTLHAIGSQLLSRFAFELGLSPRAVVLAEEDTQICLQEALEDVFTEEPWRTRVQEAADAFGIHDQWQETVRELITNARANCLSATSLEGFGRRSVEELQAFLDAPQEGCHDDSLLQSLESVLRELPTPHLKLEHEALDTLREALTAHRQGRLRWSQWAKLSKLWGGKRWEPRLSAVKQMAGAFMVHPRLRRQLEEYVVGLFRFAGRGVERWQHYKATAGLIDHGDQEEHLLELLEHASHGPAIADRVRLLLVDEFQDTSPLQLAIFLRLAKIAERTVWVGDPKQAIYQFRGADPELMRACISTLPTSALTTSHRARPGLLHFMANIFGPVFERHGVPCPPLVPHRSDRGELGTPVRLWALETQNREEDWQALVFGLRGLLGETRVEDPVTGESRPVRPSDIAVLCRRRESCRQLAAALTAAGLEVSWQQPGILGTIEGRLIEAGLRLLLDPTDTLAAATVTFLDRPAAVSEDGWLTDRIQSLSNGSTEAAWGGHPRVAALHQARRSMHDASPWEAMEAAIEALDLPRLCLAFPHASQRLANLEALRGLANGYEERCQALHIPASPAGLLTWLQRLHHDGQDVGAEGAGPSAIRVLTYHGAKGLEWPVVVLAELDSEFEDIWRGVSVNSAQGFSMEAPLAGREIRYWFSPFDRQSTAIPYLTRLRASATARELERRASEEAVRLLYVGCTRARDHLVLAARAKQGVFFATPWLAQVLVLPAVPQNGPVVVGGVPADACWLGLMPDAVSVRPVPLWFAAPDRGPALKPAAVAASSEEAGDWMAGEVVVVGERLVSGRVEERDTFGTAVHAFLAADNGGAGREALATRLLAGYGQVGALSPEQLLLASDRLHNFLGNRYPGGTGRREWPLAYWRDGQEIWGQADLLWDLPRGWVVVDYKTFEGSAAEAASSFGGQLEQYGQAVSRASGRPVLDRWVYQVLSGRMVRIVPKVRKEQAMAAGRRRKPFVPGKVVGASVAPPVVKSAVLPVDLERLPELVPARMLNEFVYCPRLGYLEWVDGEFADNEFTEEGRYRHRRVDARAEVMPRPEVLDEEGRLLKVRSVMLSAPEIALIARMDMVEIDGMSVSPVDYKRGKRPPIPAGAWDPERVQLCAQGLILRENGYRTQGGYLYFTESRERVYVPFDDELVALTVKSLMEFMETARKGVRPPPLKDSKKCTKCSLNSICLPDEVNFLHDEDTPPRKLLPPADDTRPVYVQQQGVKLGISGQVLEARMRGEVVHEIRLMDVSQLVLMGNVEISAPAIRELCSREIPICHFTFGGRFVGMTGGLVHKNIVLRQEQFRASFDAVRCLDIARALVSSKITNCRTLLRRNHTGLSNSKLDELQDYAQSALKAKSLESLLGIEGSAARVYFGEFAGLLKQGGLQFDFSGRNRRPPRDEVNALLSLAYSLLNKDFLLVTQAVGFDPYQGFYHQPRYGRASLALDLMEEYRPLIADSVVITAVNNGVVGTGDFVRAMNAVNLSEKGRGSFIEAYERRMQEQVTHPVFKYKVSYRQLIEVQTRLVGRFLQGEIAEFPTFRTR